ncbi:MAG: carboxymuconolactone decarboxylase family protein, partial [Gaiellaceae bacterium]
MTEPARRERGIAAYASQFGVSEAEAEHMFVERFGRRFAKEAFNAAGGAWEADDSLSLRDRSLIVVAALAAQGGVESRLRVHVRWAIEHGATAA